MFDSNIAVCACDRSALRIALPACLLYVAEISPREIRGILVGMINVVSGSGFVVRQPLLISEVVVVTC